MLTQQIRFLGDSIFTDSALPVIMLAATLTAVSASSAVSAEQSAPQTGRNAPLNTEKPRSSEHRPGNVTGSNSASLAMCPASGARVAEPYRWYPKLDLTRIPFHSAAGPWGPRAPIVAPAAPVTRRSVNVSSAAQLAAEALIPGTLITVTADYIGHAVVFGDVRDVDIVVPAGRRVAQLTIGSYTPRSITERVRIRGTTPGTHSGGLIGAIAFYSYPARDIIIDGVDLNGEDGNGGHLLWNFGFPVERFAVVNVRGNAASDAGGLQGVDIVIAGNRIVSGLRTREVVGSAGGWSLRGGDRLVVYDNRIDGTRYHRIRVHPNPVPGPPQYAWVANNTLVDPNEARIFSAFHVGNNSDSDRYAAVWAVCNQVYAHSTCMPPSFDGVRASYARLIHNTLFGSITQAMQRSQQAAQGPDRDYLTGNKFSPWQAPPAWDAPGDPTTAVPMPQLRPERFNAGVRFMPCPGP